MPPIDATSAQFHVREVDARRRNILASASYPLMFDEPVTVGRDGDVRMGFAPLDSGVSRRALELRATAVGFEFELMNRQGAWLHLWGHHPGRLEAGTTAAHAWPRTALRIIGHVRDIEHWVLLECDGYGSATRTAEPAPDPVPGVTTIASIPRDLTEAQMAAVQLVFGQHLSWPPVTGPTALPLASAARRLRITDTAVAERLSHVRNRARAFGLHDAVGVTDPAYVYLLAGRGYFPFPPAIGGLDRPPGSVPTSAE